MYQNENLLLKIVFFLKVIYPVYTTKGEIMSNKSLLESAKRLNEKVLECEIELRKLKSMAVQCDNWDVKQLVVTQLGDIFLGNNSVGTIVSKVVEKLESEKS